VRDGVGDWSCAFDPAVGERIHFVRDPFSLDMTIDEYPTANAVAVTLRNDAA
jgi:hypothetical protein